MGEDFPDDIDWSSLERRLHDPDPVVRMTATVEAMTAAPPGIIQSGLRDLLVDPDGVIREAAAQALGMQQDVESTEHVAALLAQTKPSEAYGIAWAVAELAIVSESAALMELADRSLSEYRTRARGRTRLHADLLLRRLAAAQTAQRSTTG